MAYQSKTTLVTLSVSRWSEEDAPSDLLTLHVKAAYIFAIHLAEQCQMDIMSFTYQQEKETADVVATVVYVNNGRSLDEIRAIMKPIIDRPLPTRWRLLEIENRGGWFDFYVSVIP
jgi:hypothetical protein